MAGVQKQGGGDVPQYIKMAARAASSRLSTDDPQVVRGWAEIAKCEGRKAECFLADALVQILDATNDKDKKVASAATDTARAEVEMASPIAIELMMSAFLSGLSVKAKPPQKEATLNMIKDFAARNAKATGYALVTLVSPVGDLTCDIKKEVEAAAVECMTAICNCTGNKDLEPFLPFVVEAAQSIKQTHGCVEKLAGCIFVQNVETPALATTLPVLFRGLNDKSQELRRTCCLIGDNMCKLVEDPAEVLPLMSRLEPLVKSATEKIADLEARGVCGVGLQGAAEGCWRWQRRREQNSGSQGCAGYLQDRSRRQGQWRGVRHRGPALRWACGCGDEHAAVRCGHVEVRVGPGSLSQRD